MPLDNPFQDQGSPEPASGALEARLVALNIQLPILGLTASMPSEFRMAMTAAFLQASEEMSPPGARGVDEIEGTAAEFAQRVTDICERMTKAIELSMEYRGNNG